LAGVNPRRSRLDGGRVGVKEFIWKLPTHDYAALRSSLFTRGDWKKEMIASAWFM